MEEGSDFSILIVDDDPDQLNIFVRLLKQKKINVRTASTGKECLELSRLNKPDLILLDVMLPDINGTEICKTIKGDPDLQSIHVLLLSAIKTKSDNIAEGLLCGADGYLVKPINNTEFLAQVEAALRIVKVENQIRELNETLEQRVAERTYQLELSRRELESKNELLEQFVFIASHDLQEPLRTLINFTNLIQKDYGEKLDEEGGRYLGFISGSAYRMRELVTGLLEYALLGKESVLSLVDCNKLVNEVLLDLSDFINDVNPAITINSLPTINGYAIELRLLFQNLITNAIKFRKKEVRPEITITAENKDKEWLFSIADNGLGIKERDKEKVFIIFKRMHKQKDYPGTGIGLAHCKKIVELHRGRIWVESNIEGGSTFRFTIPILRFEDLGI